MSTPMGRDEVLAVLEGAANRGLALDDDIFFDAAMQARAAVAAIYERCEALEREVESRKQQTKDDILNIFGLRGERDAFKRALNERNKGAWLDGKRYFCKVCRTGYGTEPSDAEGGG